MAAEIVIRDAPDEGRFIAELGRESASVWYRNDGKTLSFFRVDISDDLVAAGVGIQLMRVAMAHARQQGRLVEPACAFVVDYMRQNPETQDLLPSSSWRLLATQPAAQRGTEPLTRREILVLQGVAAGLENKQIALRLGVSPATVKEHLAHAMTKLRANNRSHALVIALERGYLR